MFLEKIKSPDDLKKINKQDYPALCGEIRRALVENVMKTGGHLAVKFGCCGAYAGISPCF